MMMHAGDGAQGFVAAGGSAMAEGVAGEERPAASKAADAKKAKIDAIWEELNAKEPVASAKLGRAKVQKVAKSSKPAKAVPSWMVNLGLAPARASTTKKPGEACLRGDKTLKSTAGAAGSGEVKTGPAAQADRADGEIAESVAATATGTDSNVKALPSGAAEGTEAAKSADPTARATQDAAKAAQASRRKSQMQASSSAGLDGLLQQISKKQKPNILDRSRKDWGVFKEEKGFEDELEAYKKSGDKYLDKVAFLQRADVREYEKERDARLALQSKQRSETIPSLD